MLWCFTKRLPAARRLTTIIREFLMSRLFVAISRHKFSFISKRVQSIVVRAVPKDVEKKKLPFFFILHSFATRIYFVLSHRRLRLFFSYIYCENIACTFIFGQRTQTLSIYICLPTLASLNYIEIKKITIYTQRHWLYTKRVETRLRATYI